MFGEGPRRAPETVSSDTGTMLAQHLDAPQGHVASGGDGKASGPPVARKPTREEFMRAMVGQGRMGGRAAG
jgi:hypothetical protein